MTREEAIDLIQKSHPFYWKGCTRTFFDIPKKPNGNEQVFLAWDKKSGEQIFRITESELNQAFEVLKNEQT